MTFDSREYEWSDITLILGGKDITGIRGIKYSEKQEKEPVYGKGAKPHSVQKGNISYEGAITVLQSELETLRANAKNRSILNLNLDAIVAYGDPSKGDAMVTDILKGVQFTEAPHESKQGDKFMEVALPIIFLDIK